MKSDDYLYSMLSAAHDEVSRRDEAEGKSPGSTRVCIPMLFEVTSCWRPYDIPDCKITSWLGNIVACTGTFETVQALESDPRVLAIEASRPSSGFELSNSAPFVKANAVHQPPLSEKGDRALIAVIDGGLDALHHAFLDAQGGTRIIEIWDQTDDTGPSPQIYTGPANKSYGTLHTKAQIDGYIAQGAVPSKLGRDVEVHGTHVASIAAGRAVSAFAGGIAPEAKIVFVKPRLSTGPGDPFSLGYSVSHQDALAYIALVAAREQLPVVVNVSQGMNAGAHDGTSRLEAAFDAFSEGGRRGGRIIVKSAGNERGHAGHAKIHIGSNATETLVWDSHNFHRGPDVFELWFNPCDELKFRLRTPSGNATNWVSRCNDFEGGFFPSGNKFEIKYTRLFKDNGDSKLLVNIWAAGSVTIERGKWELEIESESVKPPGEILAWIERNDGRPVSFISHLSDDMTLSIPGTARTVITVGSIATGKPFKVANYSSYGPTRDGRLKPDLAAPGEAIEAAEGNTIDGVVASSGTSMAAPHVAGAIALLLSHTAKQAANQPSPFMPNSAQIRAALTQVGAGYTGVHHPGMGFGVLDVEELISAFG